MLVAAMAAAAPGERVFDLCAAPGGKTTALAASMKGEGLLVANEIHPGRASILSQNVERMGIPHAVVTNEPPGTLAAAFPGYFDLIVVDAPCSGEGMFRKEPQALDIWSLDNIHKCAERQQDILTEAAKMLRPGGRLVYSTCTFAPEEDEESVERFIASHPDFTLTEQRRLWPHKIDGEGHFAALMKRGGAADSALAGRNSSRRAGHISRDRMKLWQTWAEENLARDPSAGGTLITFGDNLYLLPADIPLSGLRVLRPGLQLGSFVRNRFEPAHALALSLRPEDVRASLTLDCEAAVSYISGLSVPDEEHRGWVLVCVDGYSLAWGKSAAGTCKNHYPKGLRRQL
jgi:NOL1/NOP2/fmu family ribosome biogenesis protein/23S rRNA U2552 (ribose-2'-O)-methylase RlmE/FtsJ